MPRPIAIYYEQPHWFKPLFAELDRRGIPYLKIDATEHSYSIEGQSEQEYALVVNRMSPSAWNREHGDTIFYTLGFLDHLESRGVRVINGTKAFRSELSKASQLSLLNSLGIAYPKARVVHRPAQAVAATTGLRFPVVVKPNIGGSGAGVKRFDSREQLAASATAGELLFGLDSTALVQEFIPAQGGFIVRCEVLDGKFLYAIKVHTSGETFDLCPADICRTTGGVDLNRAACAVDAPKSGIRVEGYEPPATVVAEVERIMAAAGVELGGVEYMLDDRDGDAAVPLYYDINALSNFVADGEHVVGFDPFVRLVDWLSVEAAKSSASQWHAENDVAMGIGQTAGGALMRYGFWMPVFGGWLRNVEDEGMEASWAYTKQLAQRAEHLGYDLSLIAELNLNDIKGVEAPSLDAWSTAAALAAVTEKLEIMVAVRPSFHNPALLAKQAANIDHISNGRLTLNVVSSWWADEATKYGLHFDQHDDRYARTNEWLDVLNGCWSRQRFSFQGKYYNVQDNVLAPKPVSKPRPTLYAGGESETAKTLIAGKCDAYLMHGDSPATVGRKIADMRERRQRAGLEPMTFGVAGYVIVRDTAEAAQKEVIRITDVQQSAQGYKNYQQWIAGSQLEQKVSLEDYSVSNRGLRSGLVGTPEYVRSQIAAFEEAGCDLVLLQMSPQLEEMERFAAQVM